MATTVKSKNGVRIRLTDERWAHITEEHCELAGLRAGAAKPVTAPGVPKGYRGELVTNDCIQPPAVLS